jgi:hypothetical protein
MTAHPRRFFPRFQKFPGDPPLIKECLIPVLRRLPRFAPELAPRSSRYCTRFEPPPAAQENAETKKIFATDLNQLHTDKKNESFI